MTIARIDRDTGQLTNDRLASFDAVPEHKRGEWREVPEQESYDPRVSSITGLVLIDDALAWNVATISLVDAKRVFTKLIDDAAEAERLKYITYGSGQALEYQRVAEEARRYAENSEGSFPMLQASVDAGEAISLADAAALITAHDSAWQTIGSEIRRIRLTAKIALDEATTVEEVAAAYDDISWPVVN
jgi:hypothetical protein